MRWMWNSTSSPQRKPKPAAASSASACCSTRRGSAATALPSSHQGSQRSQPVCGAQGSTVKLAGSGSSSTLLAAPKPGSAASAPASKTGTAVRSAVSFSSSVLTMPMPSVQRRAQGGVFASTSVLLR